MTRDFPESGSSVTLSIIGDGPERSRLEEQTQQLGLDNQVRFLGRLDRSSVRDVLRAAHAFVLPSHHETFSVALLEAMATGLPVVATASGGPQDLITPDTGLLVPPDDADALANALQRLRRSWSSFGSDTIRSYVRDQYGPTAFVDRTRSLYRQALDKAHP
jgi:glycosyltransferase involved in cell wall biosynthesis